MPKEGRGAVGAAGGSSGAIAAADKLRGVIAAAACLLAIGCVWSIWPDASTGAAEATLPAARADLAARRTGSAARDAQIVWVRRFHAELGRDYAMANVRNFVRQAPSACSGASLAEGPFYCEAAAELGLDLDFFDRLGGRFQRDAERVSAVFVARVVASHAQAALGWSGAEAGDCLAGVWAADAAARIGDVQPDLYGRLLVSAGEIVGEAGLRRPDAVLFASGARGARQEAYGRGWKEGRIAACAPRR